jgi:hypothetical protein
MTKKLMLGLASLVLLLALVPATALAAGRNNNMGTPVFISTPPAQTADTWASFVIDVEHGSWGPNTSLTSTINGGHMIGRPVQGSEQFIQNFDALDPGHQYALFLFTDDNTGAELGRLEYEWDITAP